MTVPAAQFVREEVEHRLAEGKLAFLRGADEIRGQRSETKDLIRHRPWKGGRRPLQVILHRPDPDSGARRQRFLLDGLGDVLPRVITDYADAVIRADVEAGPHRISGAGRQLRLHHAKSLDHQSAGVC